MQNEDLLKDPTVSLKYYKQKLKSKYQLRTKVKGHYLVSSKGSIVLQAIAGTILEKHKPQELIMKKSKESQNYFDTSRRWTVLNCSP